jgi:hypothetical protein
MRWANGTGASAGAPAPPNCLSMIFTIGSCWPASMVAMVSMNPVLAIAQAACSNSPKPGAAV